jgi:hypothetical protein
MRCRGRYNDEDLIVDRDLGFVFWLGHLLDSAGYQPLPAKDVAAARALIDRFNVGINLVILAHTLEDAGDLVERLRRTQRELHVIYLYRESEEPRPRPGADVWVCKPSSHDQMSRGDLAGNGPAYFQACGVKNPIPPLTKFNPAALHPEITAGRSSAP